MVDPAAAHLLRPDDSRERAVVGGGGVGAEAVARRSACARPTRSPAGRRRGACAGPARSRTPSRCPDRRRSGARRSRRRLGGVGDAHPHALDLAGAPVLGAVDLELGVVARPGSRSGAASRPPCRPRRRAARRGPPSRSRGARSRRSADRAGACAAEALVEGRVVRVRAPARSRASCRRRSCRGPASRSRSRRWSGPGRRASAMSTTRRARPALSSSPSAARARQALGILTLRTPPPAASRIAPGLHGPALAAPLEIAAPDPASGHALGP